MLTSIERDDLVTRSAIDLYRAVVTGDCLAAASVCRDLRDSGDDTAQSWVGILLSDLLKPTAVWI